MKILVIEDEESLSESIAAYLKGEQYICECAPDFVAAREKLELYQYDCILLDITLPGGSGLKLLEDIRINKQHDGVIIISARDSLDEKIQGLQLGADDYLTKPFHLAELGARVASVIRRRNFNGDNIIKVNEIEIDLQSKTVKAPENVLDLTPTEYDLMLFLASNKNKVVSKNAIAQHLLGDEAEWMLQYDVIYAHIKNLKKKLLNAGCRNCIHSRYGMGYILEE